EVVASSAACRCSGLHLPGNPACWKVKLVGADVRSEKGYDEKAKSMTAEKAEDVGDRHRDGKRDRRHDGKHRRDESRVTCPSWGPCPSSLSSTRGSDNFRHSSRRCDSGG